MALSTCKDCNREVSTLARHCVHCGRPRPTGVSTCSIFGSVIAVVLAIALTGAVICAAKRACHCISHKADKCFKFNAAPAGEKSAEIRWTCPGGPCEKPATDSKESDK